MAGINTALRLSMPAPSVQALGEIVLDQDWFGSTASLDFLLESLATMFAVFFLTSPVKQVQEVHRSPTSINQVNPLNLLSIYGNCVVQVAYGLYLPMPPAIPCNLYGTAVSVCCLGCCWWYALRVGGAGQWNASAAVGTAATVTLSLLVFLYAGIPLHERAAEHVGVLAMLLNILMQSMPLWVPNALGVLMSITQLALIFLLPTKKGSRVKVSKFQDP